jgi:hypothetical protein
VETQSLSCTPKCDRSSTAKVKWVELNLQQVTENLKCVALAPRMSAHRNVESCKFHRSTGFACAHPDDENLFGQPDERLTYK